VTDVPDHRRTKEASRESESFALSALNSLSAHVAILDESGNVVFVNKAWREFAEANGADSNVGEGANYLRVCDSTAGAGAEEAAAFAEGIRSVISGRQEEFALEYPCHSPTERRWFVGRVTLLLASGPPRAVVAHENITERKRAEEELRLRDRAIAASSSGVVITDTNRPDNPIIYVNPAFERVTGYAAEEVLGRNCRFLQGTDREQPALEELRAALGEDRECRVVLRNYKKDGTMFWNELSISPVRGEGGELTSFVGVQEDITQRIKAEEERARLLVREQAARAEAEAVQVRLKTILDNLTEGVLVADELGGVVFANPAAYAMLNSTDGDALEELPDLWEDFHLPEAVARCARDKVSIEARVRHGESYLRVRLESLLNSQRDDVLVVMQDLSEGHRLEANQQRFLANAAHQLRTPTMAIMGAAELLATGEDENPSTRRRLLNHIFSEGRRMRRLSDALLRLSRVGWDLREPELEIVDLGPAAQQAAELMEPLVESAGLGISFEGEGACVLADPEWLQEVLLVLLSNAIKHSSRGGDIRLRARGNTVTVEDEGAGISAVDLPHVFERFYRGKGSSEGFGLGLPICRELTERMGGNISIRSREGISTTARIELPEADPDAQHTNRRG
jgi:PAS domain S-box-containing protein